MSHNQLCLKRCHRCDPRIKVNSCSSLASGSCSCVTQQAPREVGSKSSLWLTSRERTLASHHDYPKHVSYRLTSKRLNLSTALSSSLFVLRYFGNGSGMGKSSKIHTSNFLDSLSKSQFLVWPHIPWTDSSRGPVKYLSSPWGTKFHLGQPYSSAR